MALETKAIIVSFCNDCKAVMGCGLDQVSPGGFWEAPVVGVQIEAHIITEVGQLLDPQPNPGFPVYVVWLDTRTVPHCDAVSR